MLTSARRSEYPRPRRPLLQFAASGLDLLITVYAASLVLLAFTGGVDLGVVSVSGAAKPILMLVLLVPLRLALGGRSWLADAARAARERTADAAARIRARTPAAAVDSAFAVGIVSVASIGVAFLANLTLVPARPRGFTLPFAQDAFVQVFAAWDSGWYWDIATRGYYFRADGPSSIAFFPLYPMLMRALAPLFGGGDQGAWIAGIAISFAAFGLALAAIHRLTERILGTREVARRTVLYMAAFPWAVFMTRIYPESLFLLTSVLAVSRAYDGRWWRAGAWGALAALARPNGILIALPLLLLAWRGTPGWRPLASRVLPLAIVPAALLGHSAFVYALTGDPLGWMSAQAHWGYTLWNPPWQQLLRMLSTLVEHGPYNYFFVSEAAPFELLHGACALFFLALTPAVFRTLGPAMGVYVLASLLVPLSSNALEGIGRYASVLFPVFMCAAHLSSPRVHEAGVMISLAFHVLAAWMFVTWQPIY